MHEVCIDGETLTIEDVVKVARKNTKVVIPEEVKNASKEAARFWKNSLKVFSDTKLK